MQQDGREQEQPPPPLASTPTALADRVGDNPFVAIEAFKVGIAIIGLLFLCGLMAYSDARRMILFTSVLAVVEPYNPPSVASTDTPHGLNTWQHKTYYAYEVNGKTYHGWGEENVRRPIPLGATITAWYNTRDPGESTLPPLVSHTTPAFIILLSILPVAIVMATVADTRRVMVPTGSATQSTTSPKRAIYRLLFIYAILSVVSAVAEILLLPALPTIPAWWIGMTWAFLGVPSLTWASNRAFILRD
jgi:hypothetical protein